jgi:hypothetical protein
MLNEFKIKSCLKAQIIDADKKEPNICFLELFFVEKRDQEIIVNICVHKVYAIYNILKSKFCGVNCHKGY